ncbi:alpha-amylase family glycosyl hydrolase [Opitutus terrae]|uniref:Alpha amylase catalytic region n=1 Tax=Opitutus terrae (strain DSM 11246 / JCM 15787 / PB90-1) TaxID=452637 RepID=B1ZWN0_OPITP|nr:alpha-amylase family glycosyl hydrolase [Opitutus terrae]ACB74157.1 alpha amylase catalytic region [Opitutus terrae PB90-1]
MTKSPRLLVSACVALAGCASVLFSAEPPQICAGQPALGQPEWVRTATIYEVNVRQYSPAGNFAAVTADLPRLRDLGVNVLWLMPIHPIGEHNRKGPLGSYYAVRDYYGVNTEFGTKEDFKRLVDSAHAAGLRVILDWVGNHTAWDNPLTQQNPDYFVRDAKGSFVPPTGFDWTDVIQLDFSNPAVLDYQAGAMAYWIENFGVDGYRCDFATGVPTAFWNQLTARLRAIRPDLFMLAESELPQHQLAAFNASYGFDMMHTFNAVAQGHVGVSGIDDTLARSRVRLPAGGALLYYTSNHDENSWQGTEFERLGGGATPLAVLSFALDGIPLIYNGQEIGVNRRLEFFERDPIQWTTAHPLTAFYRTLCQLKHAHPAMRTGTPMRRLATTQNDSLYVLVREAGSHRVVVMLNLTARDVTADCHDAALAGSWRDAFTGENLVLPAGSTLALRAWSYRVLASQP